MSTPREAPLYTHCHDLVLALTQIEPTPTLRPVLERAWALLDAIAVALSLPGERPSALAEADRRVAQLKVGLRVVEAAGGLSEGRARVLGESLVDIGRMIGGWRRRERSQKTQTE